MARFIEDFELLGFDVNAVRKLASWRKSLIDMGIEPDKLGDFIRERGSLERQLANLAMEKAAGERRVKELKMEHLKLWGQVSSIKDEVFKLFDFKSALKHGRIVLLCKVCRIQGIPMDLDTVKGAIMTGSWCSGMCVFCGQWSSYAAWDVAYLVAQLVLPAIRPTRSVAEKRGG